MFLAPAPRRGSPVVELSSPDRANPPFIILTHRSGGKPSRVRSLDRASPAMQSLWCLVSERDQRRTGRTAPRAGGDQRTASPVGSTRRSAELFAASVPRDGRHRHGRQLFGPALRSQRHHSGDAIAAQVSHSAVALATADRAATPERRRGGQPEQLAPARSTVPPRPARAAPRPLRTPPLPASRRRLHARVPAVS